MMSAPAVMPESSSLSLTQQCAQPRSPLATGSAVVDFDLWDWGLPLKRPIVSATTLAPAVVPESPSLSPTQQSAQPGSPLAIGSAVVNFDLWDWGLPLNRAAPPLVIEVPHSHRSDDDISSGSGYMSLRDILSSPEYAAARCPGAGGHCSCGDIDMIRNPLVKHAAYTYLHLTPSAWEDPGRRGRLWRGPLCRILRVCFSFIGALFQP